jgi:hypothetical protein
MNHPPIENGETVRITVEAIVTDYSDSHGLCYQVELPQKDYSKPRRIWVDADELTNVE